MKSPILFDSLVGPAGKKVQQVAAQTSSVCRYRGSVAAAPKPALRYRHGRLVPAIHALSAAPQTWMAAINATSAGLTAAQRGGMTGDQGERSRRYETDVAFCFPWPACTSSQIRAGVSGSSRGSAPS